jgi:DNA-binding NtrC family response regulator
MRMGARDRILVVDDDPDIRDLLVEYFTAEGYSVTPAADGPEAFEALRRDPQMLVLLDVGLPGMDGVEVLKRIRHDHPGASVIMITGNQDLELAREAVRLGAVDHVFKPFDSERLERALATAVRTMRESFGVSR